MNEQFEMQFETSGYEIGHLGVVRPDADRWCKVTHVVDPEFIFERHLNNLSSILKLPREPVKTFI